MTIQARCPGCRATLKVAESMCGKKVRCGDCKEVFVIEPGGRGYHDADEDDRVRATPPPAKSSSGVRRRRDDDEYDDRDERDDRDDRGRDRRKPAAESSNAPWIIAGGAVACVAILAIAGV